MRFIETIRRSLRTSASDGGAQETDSPMAASDRPAADAGGSPAGTPDYVPPPVATNGLPIKVRPESGLGAP